MDFDKEQSQFILMAIDTHIKQVGIQGAKMGLIVASKLQDGLKIQQDLENLKTEAKGE